MKKKGLKALIANVVAIAICFTSLIGTTFAWFTDTASSSNNVIASGTLDVNAYWMDGKSDPEEESNWIEFSQEPIFNYANWEPGYVESKHVKVVNNGSLAFKYKLLIAPNGPVSDLANVIDVYYLEQATKLSRESLASATKVGTLAELIADPDGAAYGVLLPKNATPKNDYEVVEKVAVSIAFKMRENVGSEYFGKSIGSNFNVTVYATQYEYEEDCFGSDYDKDATYPDSWDGSIDTSWYNAEATEFTLSSAEQFAGFASLVGTTDQFEGKTVALECDVDLNSKVFAPIGSTGENDERGRLITQSFKGTFDGQGHAIENLYQSGWEFGYMWGQYGSVGLFSSLESATIKNLTVSGAEAQIEGGDIGGITGSAEGNCVFENITIEDCDLGTYNNGIGGIIGWSGAGEYTFKNVTISEDVVLGGLWGSFDSSIGGVVGQGEPGATYNFENVNVACRLDAYNDVTASYQYYLYRMTGMLIGRLEKTTTIDGINYPDMSQYNITCTNVTVTYGDWMNYHYCLGFNGNRYTRIEAGYTYGGLDINAEGHDTTCTDHMLLLPFEGLFGGDQYGVRPITEFSGVTVIKP